MYVFYIILSLFIVTVVYLYINTAKLLNCEKKINLLVYLGEDWYGYAEESRYYKSRVQKLLILFFILGIVLIAFF